MPMFSSMGTFGARAELRKNCQEKNAGRRGSRVFGVRSFGSISFGCGQCDIEREVVFPMFMQSCQDVYGVPIHSPY